MGESGDGGDKLFKGKSSLPGCHLLSLAIVYGATPSEALPGLGFLLTTIFRVDTINPSLSLLLLLLISLNHA